MQLQQSLSEFFTHSLAPNGPGVSPQAAFVGNFDAQPGLDLVSVNAGSNSLTFFSNFTAPDTFGINIASGGLIPVAALAGDFNGDGLSDLVVANNGDGAISLFLGQEDGLSLEAIRFLADLPHPTALALAEATTTELDVYVAGEGTEAVRLLSFVSSDLGPIALATSASLGFVGNGQGQVGDLLPLQDTFLATVAVLLTVRLESEALPARLEQEVGLAVGGEAGFPEFVRLLLEGCGRVPMLVDRLR